MALLKLVTRIECDFYIDYDFKLHLKPGSLSRLNIRKGTYELVFINGDKKEVVNIIIN